MINKDVESEALLSGKRVKRDLKKAWDNFKASAGFVTFIKTVKN
jgi:hypothetical protein